MVLLPRRARPHNYFILDHKPDFSFYFLEGEGGSLAGYFSFYALVFTCIKGKKNIVAHFLVDQVINIKPSSKR